jgi:hypothetical protein
MKLIEIGFRYYPVRMSGAGDMPEFDGIMLINQNGQCTTTGPVLKLDKSQMRTWNKFKRPDGNMRITFQIYGKTFYVLPDYYDLAEDFFSQELSSFFDVKFPEG